MRKFLRWIIIILFRLFSHLEIYGLENVPKHGNGIICSNHMGTLDPPIVFAAIEREDITGMAAKNHRKNPFFRFMINSVGGIWLNREEADTHAMREVIDRLQKGWLVGIAPEGTRSKTGAMIRAKTGTAYLADRAKVQIIPAGITGTYRAVWGLLRFKRPVISVRFGKPFRLPQIDRKERDAGLQRNTDEIMCQIAALLPPQYWGEYENHPRLREILEEQKAEQDVQAQQVITAHSEEMQRY